MLIIMHIFMLKIKGQYFLEIHQKPFTQKNNPLLYLYRLNFHTCNYPNHLTSFILMGMVIFLKTNLYMSLVVRGWDAVEIDLEDWILLPDGGNLYELPGRRGIGLDVVTGEMRLCEKGWAVAAFIPPAHTGFYMSAYETLPDAPTLPLFCYTAVGWHNDLFYVPAMRIEQDIRQECAGFDDKK